MIWVYIILLNILIIKYSHGLNSLLQPAAAEQKWHRDFLFQIINELNQHRETNMYENNDIAFLQFGNDSAGFIDQVFTKFYWQFNDRAMVITRIPLVKENVIFNKSTLIVLFMCYYDKMELQTFLKEIQLSVFWHSIKPILVVPTFPITLKNYNRLNYLFGFFKYEYLFNVGIIYYSRRYDRIERIGYNPFAINPIVIDPKYLFENKIKNLNGYEIKITQYYDNPRSIIDENGIINGMDGLVLKTVCQHLNASCRVFVATGGPETSYSNVIFDLVTRRADLNFNHRIFWSKNYLKSIAIPIYPYEQEDIVLMVPSANLIMPYRHFVDAFKTELWIMIAFIFLVVTAIWFMLNPRLKTFRNRFEVIDIGLDVVRMHLALPLPRVITNTRERRLFWLISMYTFIIFQTYQTKLTSYLMSTRYTQNYQTIAEVNDSNLELVLSKNYQVLVNHFLDTNPMKNKQIDTDLSIWQLRQAILDNDELYNFRKAFFVTKQESNIFKYSMLNQIQDDLLLETVDEKILTSAASYTTLKNSPFENEISNVIRKIRESGLYDYFKEVGFFDVRQHINVTSKLFMQSNIKHTRVQLSIRVFMPILHMFATGLFFSVVCFFVEYSTKWMNISARRVRRRLRKWRIKAIVKRLFFRFINYLLKD